MDKQFYLKLTEDDLIYVSLSGDEKGLPILLFHGGPGDGSGKSSLNFFSKENFLIQFDQRGAGKSQKLKGDILENNNTLELANDAIKILDFLGLESAIFYGSSWGSTLALYTACTYPERCRGLILKSVFLADNKQGEWVYENGGASTFYPDEYKKFCDFLEQYRQNGENNRQVMQKLILRHDEYAYQLASVINTYELSLLAPIDLLEYWSKEDMGSDNKDDFEDENESQADLNIYTYVNNYKKDEIITQNMNRSFVGNCHLPEYTFLDNLYRQVRISLHYAASNYFIQEESIVRKIEKLRADIKNKFINIPSLIIHGRIDMLCPIYAAYELNRILPNSDLHIIPYGSHYSVAEVELEDVSRTIEAYLKNI